MYIEEAKKSVKKLDKILKELEVNLANGRREAIWELPSGVLPEKWNRLLDDVKEIKDIVSDWEWESLRH